MQSQPFDPGMPLGPFKALEDLEHRFNKWSQSGVETFSIGRESTVKTNKTKGRTVVLVCSRSGQPRKRDNPQRKRTSLKCGCPWSIFVEEIDTGDGRIGWVPVSLHKRTMEMTPVRDETRGYHNHDLMKTDTERMQDPNQRSIPERYDELAIAMLKVGLTYKQVYSFLKSKCADDNITALFTVTDVKNTYRIPESEKCLDATNLVQYLEERQEQDPSLFFDFQTDEDGRLSRVFFVLEGGKKLWEQSTAKVTLFDTKHGTNSTPSSSDASPPLTKMARRRLWLPLLF